MITSEYKSSIQKEIRIKIFTVITMMFVLGYSVFLMWYLDDQKEDNLELSQSITSVISQDMAKLILLNQIEIGADITSKLKTFKQINSVVLFNFEKKPIYKYSKNNKPFKIDKFLENGYQIQGNILKVFTTAKYQKMEVGYVEFNIKIETLKDVLKDDIFILLVLFILVMIISYLLAIIYSRPFTQPIVKLVDFLEKIEFENIKSINHKIEITDNNEFGKLYEEINILLEKLVDFINQQKISLVAFETKSGMVITDENMNVLKVNKSYEKITGYSQEEIIDNKLPLFNDKDLYYKIHHSLSKYNYWSGEITHKRKDGKELIVYLTIQAVFDDYKITNYVFSFVDITHQKEVEKKLELLEQYDALTGFVNKNYFLKYLHSVIQDKFYQSLFYIKIINLKTINNVYGYEIGDFVLKEIAQRLKNEFKDAVIAKIEANEFVFYYKLFGDKNKSIKKSKHIAEIIEGVFLEPITIDDISISLKINIGINIFNEREDELNVLKEVNLALQTAKNEHKKVVIFDKNIEIKTKENFIIYEDLLKALKNNEFELYYQLQYDNKNEIYGAEALIRWNHPKLGFLTPYKFIPIAEKTDLIIDIGNWVLDKACKQLSIWAKNDITKNWVLAVNVNAKQFKKADFLIKVFEAIQKYDVNPEMLKIELLETTFVDDFEEVSAKMNELKQFGIKLSLDDFGTGFSSLQYLKSFPLDQIKIDQSFIMNMFNNQKDTKIIKSIIYLGELLEINVIAEGVEEKEHYEKLNELGCHYYQGYYFAKPKSIEYINKNVIKL